MKSKSNRALSLQPVTKLPLPGQMFFSMLDKLEHGMLDVTTPDGLVRSFGQTSSDVNAQLHIHDWQATHLILVQGDIGFAESVRRGWVSSPDLLALFRLAIHNQQVLEQAIHGKWWALLVRRLSHLWLHANSRSGSKRNIHAHYDLGNDFYQQWLDPSMTYSAAWFGKQREQSLEQAQHAKYQRILDELDAQPGQHILEIGCGWGGFAEYAAQRGFKVDGITLSPAQLAFAEQRIHKQGLDAQVNLRLQDYRDLDGQYDHIVSIEMLEAVGETHWQTYFSILQHCLKPGGKVVIQCIDIADRYFPHYRSSTDFIQQFIFPGGMLPCPSSLYTHAQRAGLKVKRLQSFGQDYAHTLHLWHQRFMSQLSAIRAQGFDDAFIRLWEMYLKYCEAGFIEQRTDVKLWTLHRY